MEPLVKVKVSNMIRDGQHDILKSSWLLQCIKSGSLVPIQRRCAPDSTGVGFRPREADRGRLWGTPIAFRARHIVYLTPATRRRMARYSDPLGDSYTAAVTTNELKDVRAALLRHPKPSSGSP